jgi:DinB family protein
MKKITWLALMMLPLLVSAQEVQRWTEDDRKYLLENLIRTRDELLKETEGLSKKQWTFKESPDRWSINEVVEHLAIFELIFDREIGRSLGGKPQPEFNKDVKPDSFYSNFIMEDDPHVTTDFTKPFTYSVPLGMNDIKNNIAWFVKMRNESVEFIKTTREDLRLYYRNAGIANLHQTYMYVFGHVDRHLRQIKKIKQHQNYPR